MRKLFTYFLLATALLFVGCETFDDSQIWEKLNSHENRIQKLEQLCTQMNTNITSLQALIEALEENDYITSVSPITEDGQVVGYTISFAYGDPITLYHGQKGHDGQDGVDGKSPIIGVKQDADGLYYWTLDGEWLTDENGEKIQAEGRDGESGTDGTDGESGQDGITPQLKIENDYWYVSYDNGTTWVELYQATGEDGDSFFQSVTQDEDNVYFTLTDGTVITIPKGSTLSIEFIESDLVVMSPNSTREVGYTVISSTSSAQVEVTSSSDIKAKVVADDASGLSGKIHITTGATIDEYSKVILLVTNGEKVIMRSITFEEPGLAVEESATKEATSEGGEVALAFLSNVECEVIIPEEAQSWISVLPDTRALEERTITLKLEPNEGYTRSATVTVQSIDGALKLAYTIEQKGELIETTTLYYLTGSYKPISITASKFDKPLLSNEYDSSMEMYALVFEGRLTTIPKYAFNNSRVEKMIIPEGIEIIEEMAFNNSDITEITLPSTLKEIGTDAFYSYPCGLINVYISDLEAWCKTDLGSGIFTYSYGSDYEYSLYLNGEKITELVIPEGVTEVKPHTFEGLNTLTSVTLHDKVTTLGAKAFAFCTSLTEVTLGSQLTSIGDSAFTSCKALTQIEIPDSVSKIGNRAFSSCTALSEITLGQGVETIGEYTFENCSLLESIAIPASVTTIGKYAFNECSSLKRVDITDLKAWCCIDFGMTYGNPLSVAKQLYLNNEIVTEITIPAGCTELKPYVFESCSTLSRVTIPDSVTSIGKDAFTLCTALSEIDLGQGVTTINNYAFSRCDLLTEITIPASVTFVGINALGDSLKGLNRINITDMEAWCNIDFESSPAGGNFELYLNGSEVTEVLFPATMNQVKPYTFAGVKSLTQITLHDAITTIGKNAFESTSLNEIVIPKALVKVRENAFRYCKNLSKVKIYDLEAWCKIAWSSSETNPLYYAKRLFLNENEVTQLTIPDTVTKINSFAFQNCPSITDVTLHKWITSVGEFAFKDCTGLTEITVPASVTYLGRGAFANDNLIRAYVLSTTPCTMGYYFFGGGMWEPYIEYEQFGDALIYVPAESLDAYKAATGWNTMAENIFAAE